MKLRIQDDSLRLRLTRSEVARVAGGEKVEGRTGPPGPVSEFAYGLRADANAPSVSVAFDGRALRVALPLDIARTWAKTEQIGVDATVPIAPGRALRVLIEKDFQCLDRPDDGDVDAFPNPNAPACTAPAHRPA